MSLPDPTFTVRRRKVPGRTRRSRTLAFWEIFQDGRLAATVWADDNARTNWCISTPKDGTIGSSTSPNQAVGDAISHLTAVQQNDQQDDQKGETK